MPRGKKHSAKQVHHLLRLVPLTSCHLALLIPVSISFAGSNQAGHSTLSTHIKPETSVFLGSPIILSALE